MAGVIRDDFDFGGYMRDTEARAKVRSAAVFAEELVEKFRPVPKPTFVAEMFSTKLRDRLVFRPGEVTVWAGYNGHRKSPRSRGRWRLTCVQAESGC
jgi:twinkle protein